MLKTIRGIDNRNEFSVFVKITYEIIVQQKHVSETIPNQYKTKIIGSFEIKKIKQSERSQS